jgi:hypothetical protein
VAQAEVLLPQHQAVQVVRVQLAVVAAVVVVLAIALPRRLAVLVALEASGE